MIQTLGISGLRLTRGERTLFRDLTLVIEAGEVLALTGANGSGKTSLLRAISGFLTPAAGDIVFHDADANVIDPGLARSHQLHHLGHLDALKGARTAREELMFQSDWLGHSGLDSASGITEAIETLGLKPLLDLEVRKLSAGQRRRLAMARLIGAPRALWLLDEPLSPLDSRWREAVGAIMQAHLASGGLIIAAVHDPLPIPTRSLDLGLVG
ncbi:heme ABC exporter ATP-binding protein CcmA [Brevundimonas variabilis]|uniref:Heme exporter protein A n=1 Tax=Brevundimonas variabilis TaxID=74312 RepID=A0A7W9FDG8_9CAUL|nr:heme ABC exporter ATP-binding protein CcmA [Brevundimonas variabilis]MBB5745257.1 heme exporter protein A [Brevundimonas variabilis]